MRWHLGFLICAIAAFGLPAGAAYAAQAPGALDPGFGDGDVVLTKVGTGGGANSVAVQSDGAVVLAGEATVNGRKDFCLVRYLPDGSLDSSFGDSGTLVVPIGEGSSANSVRLAPDGKLLVSGTAMVGGALRFAVVRLTTDGRPDPTFGDGGVATNAIGYSAIAMVALPGPGGGVIVGGTARTLAVGPNKMSKLSIAVLRLDASGHPDPSFGGDGVGIAPGPAADMGLLLDSESRPVAFGVTEIDGVPAFAAARFTSDGHPDPAFAGDGSVSVPVLQASSATGGALEPDGSLTMVGAAWNGRRKVLAAARLDREGRLHPAYGEGGITISEVGGVGPNGIIRQDDGKLVVAMGGGLHAVRLGVDGYLDAAFGSAGASRNPRGEASATNGVALGPNGEIALGGIVILGGSSHFAVARLIGREQPAAAVTEPEAASVEPAPDAPAPVEPAPVEPAPVEPAPVAPQPSVGQVPSRTGDPVAQAPNRPKSRVGARDRCRKKGARPAPRSPKRCRRR